LMKMASDLVDSDSEVGGGPEAVDPLRPRARPTVWSGRRPVPGIVAPGSSGSTRSRMSPTRRPPPSAPAARSGWIAPGRRRLCPHPGSGTTEARPPANGVTPPASWRKGGLVGPIAESRPGIFGAVSGGVNDTIRDLAGGELVEGLS